MTAVKKTATRNVRQKMKQILPTQVLRLLKIIGDRANRGGYPAFVVGGLVRDLLLGMKNIDLDIVIEGDAIAFGRMLAKEFDGTLVPHRRFGTASVVIAWPFAQQKETIKIDLASARRETYERPAALPTVVGFGPLKDDLVRRDFTINAMAVSINKSNFGQLIDYFQGERDLSQGVVRVMHDGSFIDDPTRIFRAVRFEQRFGFRIDEHTEYLIRNAIREDMFGKTEKQRIRDEVILILKEPKPINAIRRMAELDEMRFISPRISIDAGIADIFRKADEAIAWYERLRQRRRTVEPWLIKFLLLVSRLSYREAESICAGFVFKRSDTMRILSFKRAQERISRILSAPKDIAPSVVYRDLEPLSYETIIALMAQTRSSRARQRIKDFFTRYNGTKLKIRGDDLMALGLKPGPAFKDILTRVLYKKIDERFESKKEELECAKKLAGAKGRTS